MENPTPPSLESTPPESNRERQRAATRTQILQAAIHVFGDRGFDAASMGGIAEQAGVKKALVQYHFDTKEKLWRAAVEAIWRERDAALPEYLSSISGAEGPGQIHALLEQIMRFARDHPAWVEIMFHECATPGPRLDWLVEHFVRRDFERAQRFAEQAQDGGLFPPCPPLELMHILSGALVYALKIAPMTQRATGQDPRSDAYLSSHVAALVSLLGVNAPRNDASTPEPRTDEEEKR